MRWSVPSASRSTSPPCNYRASTSSANHVSVRRSPTKRRSTPSQGVPSVTCPLIVDNSRWTRSLITSLRSIGASDRLIICVHSCRLWRYSWRTTKGGSRTSRGWLQGWRRSDYRQVARSRVRETQLKMWHLIVWITSQWRFMKMKLSFPSIIILRRQNNRFKNPNAEGDHPLNQ